MASKFDERRAKIDTAAIHGNPQFGKDQLAALNGQSLVDIAEALAALVGVMGGGYEPMPDPPAPLDDDADKVTPDYNDEAPDIGVNDYVATADGKVLGVVTSEGVSEGRHWVKVDAGTDAGTGKVWADQLTRIDPPAPAETERTNPEDGVEQRRKAAEAHMGNINDEPKVEYEQATFDAGKDGREFDVPIGIVGAPVKVKKAGK